jgi:hypothetical protein
MRMDSLLPGLVGAGNIVLTSWIDKQLGLSLRMKMSGRVGDGAAAVDMQVESIKRGLVFNEPLPESLFDFTPPPGAKEMDASGIGGILGLSVPLETPAPPARPGPPAGPEPRKPPSPEEPQAFVPSLNPIEPVAPDWPAGDRVVVAPVTVLVTIDPRGLVSDAEVLTGPADSREEALDAVRRLTFRPVIREGHQVAAYSTVMVPVATVSDRPSSTEINLRDELAAATRLAALERAWPRTPKQVFLDLKNDLEAADPVTRQFSLPELAKTALKAGQFEEAEQYAREALGSNGQVLDGAAVHDGHSVLGLLALERGDMDEAKRELIAAGHTTGGAVLGSFGPDLSLARRLLAAGERETVLEYLSLCEKFWTSGRTQIRSWSETIRAGGTPNLASLIF